MGIVSKILKKQSIFIKPILISSKSKINALGETTLLGTSSKQIAPYELGKKSA
jgi:hypothetical protein